MGKRLTVENLSYSYSDGTKALNSVGFTIEPGEKIVLLGSNGCGKTTLLLCLMGILKPTVGCLSLGGEAIDYSKKGLVKLRRHVGLVFQDPDTQLFCMNVEQEVMFGPLNMGLEKDEALECSKKSMEQVDVLQLAKRPPHFLSYGQKKRVSIASVLAMSPEIVLFDEPTSSLDPRHSRELVGLIGGLSKQGKAVVVSTHDMDFALAWADRIVVMSEGGVLADGNAQDIFTLDTVFEEAGLDQPIVYRVYRTLRQSGILPPTNFSPVAVDKRNPGMPRTIAELELLINAAAENVRIRKSFRQEQESLKVLIS